MCTLTAFRCRPRGRKEARKQAVVPFRFPFSFLLLAIVRFIISLHNPRDLTEMLREGFARSTPGIARRCFN